jgi:hypothetical protein
VSQVGFYEKLGIPVIYEGPEYPDFIGFGTETVHFGIQSASTGNDPPSVLTWQIGVADIDAAIERCRSAGLSFDLEQNNPAPVRFGVGEGAASAEISGWARTSPRCTTRTGPGAIIGC